jgi:glutamate racemase
VLATEGTVSGRAYHHAIANTMPQSHVAAVACGLFVALAEEGWTDGTIVESIARHYLNSLFREDPHVDTLQLGCTHFPVFRDTLQSIVGPSIAIVDSAQSAATAVECDVRHRSLLREFPETSSMRFLATDGPERFPHIGGRFLGDRLGRWNSSKSRDRAAHRSCRGHGALTQMPSGAYRVATERLRRTSAALDCAIAGTVKSR